MNTRWWVILGLVWAVLASGAVLDRALALQDDAGTGSIRGLVEDDDFDLPLAGVEVLVVEANRAVQSSDQGNYLISGLAPGSYTVIFSKEGFGRVVRTDVVVSSGAVRDLDVRMAGRFSDMEELVVDEVLELGAGSELELLQLRFDSPSLIDSIGQDLMSRATASDAADALKLVSGASVQDGKFAVVRGLPDRYVSSQLNGVRLPTSDDDKRAVELDLFPTAVLESVQVSKTFTPDQQGDASGGAVNIVLKGVPNEAVFKATAQVGVNTQVNDAGSDFLTYEGTALDTWGDSGGNAPQPIGTDWTGAVGISRGSAPSSDYKFGLTVGDRAELDSGVTIGGLASFFYERDSSYLGRGIDDTYSVRDPGDPLAPTTSGEEAAPGAEYTTSLFDVEQGTREVQWGGLATLGLQAEFVDTNLIFFYSRSAQDRTTLAEDTRGKLRHANEILGLDGYDPNDPDDPAHQGDDRNSAPFRRNETLRYQERSTQSLQWQTEITIPTSYWGWDGVLEFDDPILRTTLSRNRADLLEPDKRQFASSFRPELPPIVIGTFEFPRPAIFLAEKAGDSVNLGNVQRTFEEIVEENDQISLEVELPFDQWSGDRGFFRMGLFADRLDRTFEQAAFSNGAGVSGGPPDPIDSFEAPNGFDSFWSSVFPDELHVIDEFGLDIPYDATQDITALYAMMSMPLDDDWTLNGGLRFERTFLSVNNKPEENAQFIPKGQFSPIDARFDSDGNGSKDSVKEEIQVPGENIDEILPSVGLIWRPTRDLTLRGAYSQTIARQTFKEVVPTFQSEFLGGPVFVGNPELEQSQVENFDLRLDYVPYEGALLSVSWFQKNVDDAIEYIELATTDGGFTTPRNFPSGELSGYEFELRQDLSRFWSRAEGLTLGANATFIDSEVKNSDEVRFGTGNSSFVAGQGVEGFFGAPGSFESRDMTLAPDHLYNIFATYEVGEWGTEVSLLYAVQGDTLVSGASVANTEFTPSVYATPFDTLNLALTQRLGPYLRLKLQAKNLTNPSIDEVYRSRYFEGDTLKTSRTKGIDYSISLTGSFSF